VKYEVHSWMDAFWLVITMAASHKYPGLGAC